MKILNQLFYDEEVEKHQKYSIKNRRHKREGYPIVFTVISVDSFPHPITNKPIIVRYGLQEQITGDCLIIQTGTILFDKVSATLEQTKSTGFLSKVILNCVEIKYPWFVNNSKKDIELIT